MENRGLLIAGVGLSGIGKSTLLNALAQRKGWQRFAEPEEVQWPATARDHSLSGVFTALTWFRAMRVANLYAADRLRQQGQVALIDCYYDKLMAHSIEAPQMEWLIERSDPYFDLVKHMASVANKWLPTADVIILFTATFVSWEQCILSRKCQLDVARVFPGAFPFQNHLLRAAQLESESSGSRLLLFENQFGSIEQAVERLDALLTVEVQLD